jgi:hypothetical protein
MELYPLVVALRLPTPAVVAPPQDRWTVKSIPTALSVHAVDMPLVEAPVLVLAESFGSRLDVLQNVVFEEGGQLRHQN